MHPGAQRARRSNIPDILPPRALIAGRLARLARWSTNYDWRPISVFPWTAPLPTYSIDGYVYEGTPTARVTLDGAIVTSIRSARSRACSSAAPISTSSADRGDGPAWRRPPGLRGERGNSGQPEPSSLRV